MWRCCHGDKFVGVSLEYATTRTSAHWPYKPVCTMSAVRHHTRGTDFLCPLFFSRKALFLRGPAFLPCGRYRSEATVFCPQKGRFSLFSLLACGRIQDQDPVFMRVAGNWFDLAAAAAKGIRTCICCLFSLGMSLLCQRDAPRFSSISQLVRSGGCSASDCGQWSLSTEFTVLATMRSVGHPDLLC